MTPTQLAREALEGAGVAAPTDEQVTRCLALAALYKRDGSGEHYYRAALEMREYKQVP